MPAVRLTTFGNYAISAALAESPKPPYHVDPIRVFTCIVVMICLVLAAFAFFYIFGRLHTFVQNKILDELDDVEVQTLKTVPFIARPLIPPTSHSYTRKSSSATFCRTLGSPPAREHGLPYRRPPIRFLYPHPAPRIVPILPRIPPPVHSFSSVYAPPAQRLAYLATVPPTAEAADHTQKKLDDNLCPRDSTFDIERNAFSMVADTVVGTYPISIVHPMVKTYDIYTYQIPRSSVLSSVINTLNDVPAPAYASTKPVSLPSPLSLTPTLAVTPPTPEKPSVLAMRKSTITTPSSPTSVKRNLHGAEAGMHKVRKAKRYRGKENRAPVPIGHRARLNLV